MKTIDIKLTADKLTVRGPGVDGGWKITLDVGEYMAEKVAALVLLPQQVPLEVTIGPYYNTEEQLFEKADDHGREQSTETITS